MSFNLEEIYNFFPDIIAIDGKWFLYNSEFSPGLFVNGVRVSGIINFLQRLSSLCEFFDKEKIIVVWDSKKYMKKEKHPEYKKREYSEFDRQIWSQEKKIREILPTLSINSFDIFGYEADEVLAGIAFICKQNKKRCLLCSSDTDLLQLVDDYVGVLRPKQLVTKDNFENYFKMPIEVFKIKKILFGDPADNIDGVPNMTIAQFKKIISKTKDIKKLIDLPELQPYKNIILKNIELIDLTPKKELIDALEKKLKEKLELDIKKFKSLCIKYKLKKFAIKTNEFLIPFISKEKKKLKRILTL